VRVDPVAVAVNSMVDGAAAGTLLEGLISDMERDICAREATAHRMFTEFCAAEGIPSAAKPAGAPENWSAQWHVETGEQTPWMVAYGMAADLVVASRGVAEDDASAHATLVAVVVEAGRPLLIPSAAAPSVTMADRVAIAWKPTPQAARAVAFAMPFLERAKEIVVMTVEEEDGPRDEADRLVRNLAWHGLKAVAQRLKPGAGDAATTLLAAAADQAGLLVMGGYGHSQIREWVFGGFTQQVLADAPVPVLIAH